VGVGVREKKSSKRNQYERGKKENGRRSSELPQSSIEARWGQSIYTPSRERRGICPKRAIFWKKVDR